MQFTVLNVNLKVHSKLNHKHVSRHARGTNGKSKEGPTRDGDDASLTTAERTLKQRVPF